MNDLEKFCQVLNDLGIEYSRGSWQNGRDNTVTRVRVNSTNGAIQLRFDFLDGAFLDID